MTHTLTVDNAMFGHVDVDTAYLVDDYPYGFRLRTQIRYWVETNKRHGDRFVSQTMNPKTGKWNKPKPSTYVEVEVMFREDKTGHIRGAGLRVHDNDEWLEHFQRVTDGKLSPLQMDKLAEVLGVKRAFEKVTFHVGRSDEEAPDGMVPVNDNQLYGLINHEINSAKREMKA